MATAKKKPALTRQQVKKHVISFRKKLHEKFMAEAGSDQDAPNFEYTIVATGVGVSFLDINTTIVNPIPNTGKLYADRGRPFYVELWAQRNSPIGSATFQLKDLANNKNVFDSPQAFTFDNTTGKGGLYLPDIKLP